MPRVFDSWAISFSPTISSMAARRASYSAMRQLQVAEVAGRLLHGLVVDFAKRDRRGADRGHNIGARLRLACLLRGTRTGDEEQGNGQRKALRDEHGAVYRGSWLVSRVFFVARGSGCEVAEIATASLPDLWRLLRKHARAPTGQRARVACDVQWLQTWLS